MNVDFSSPMYFVATGTLTSFVVPAASHKNLSGSEKFSIGLFDYFFTRKIDCQTPVKTVDEWGISHIAKDPRAPLVSFGPFSGTQCNIKGDLSGRRPISPVVYSANGLSEGAIGGMGSSAVAHYNFTAYGADIPPPPPPDPCATPGACASNVLFLPGIEASRLYRPNYDGGTDQLWEPNADSDANDLLLTADGQSARNDIYTKDVIRQAYLVGPNIYESFVAQMDGLKTVGTITDWKSVPYDWRLSFDDILNSGHQFPDGRMYYSGDHAATSSPYIVQELRRLAGSSKTGKVTIVAHSNGGLLAKALVEKLGDTEAAKLIRFPRRVPRPLWESNS